MCFCAVVTRRWRQLCNEGENDSCDVGNNNNGDYDDDSGDGDNDDNTTRNRNISTTTDDNGNNSVCTYGSDKNLGAHC